MEQNQQPVTPVVPVAPVTASVPLTTVPDTGVKSYINMVSLAFFAGPTGLARAYRGEQAGWVRFWVFVGSYVLMIIPLINFLAALSLTVLAIWGVVDFFLVHGLRTDAAGQPLHATARDQIWAQKMKFAFIGMLCLGVLLFILGIIFGILGASLNNTLDSSSTNFYPY